MSDPGKAVFLSYASQDAEAAKRIADALRAAGVEVWFDQSELVGGDAWDQKIRRQIKECALLLPVISKTTQGRREAYFRLEWKLADERTHLMAKGTPFLLPITIDETGDRDALVPDSFLAVQWTKAPNGEVPAAFASRVQKLLAAGGVEPSVGHRASSAAPSAAAREPGIPRWARTAVALMGATSALLVAVYMMVKKEHAPERPVPVEPVVTAKPPAGSEVARSPAREMAEKAWRLALDNQKDSTGLQTAIDMAEQATRLDPLDAEVWGLAARVDLHSVVMGADRSDSRASQIRTKVARAKSLSAKSVHGRLAEAQMLEIQDSSPTRLAEAERLLLQLRTESLEPRVANDVLGHLGSNYWAQSRPLDAARIFEQAGQTNPGWMNAASWAYLEANHFSEAVAAARRQAGMDPDGGVLQEATVYLRVGDLASSEAALRRLSPAGQRTEQALAVTAWRAYLDRQWDVELAALRQLPEFLDNAYYFGPRFLFTGWAHHYAGRKEVAQLEWAGAARLLEQRLAADPSSARLRQIHPVLLQLLGREPEAESAAQIARQLGGPQTQWEIYYLALRQDREALLRLISQYIQDPNWQKNYLSTLLRLDPCLDGVRDDPRFQDLLRQAAAATAKLPGSSPAEPASRAAAPDDKSVAVLAFANLSDDKGNEYFSDGISEELLNVLAKVPGLKVSARTSAFYFKGKDVPIPEIAAKLGVAYVIEGSVRKQGEKVRITAQLIKAADGFHVWSDTFTRDLKDVFAVQDEIAGLIAQQLQLKLGGSSRANKLVNPEAYDLYLRARALSRLEDENYLPIIKLYEAAVAKDPEFALAYVQLSLACASDYWAGGLDSKPAARAALQAAQRLAPDAPETRLAAGSYAYSCENDWTLARTEFLAAEAGLPGDAQVAFFLGMVQRRLLSFDESIRQVARAIELDPADRNNFAQQVHTLKALRRYPELVDLAGAALRRFPADENFLQTQAIARCEIDHDQAAYLRRVRELPAVEARARALKDYSLALNAGEWEAAGRILAGAQLDYLSITPATTRDPIAMQQAMLAHLQGRPELAQRFGAEALAFYQAQHGSLRQDKWMKLGQALALAYAGRGEEAIRLARETLAATALRDPWDTVILHTYAGHVYLVAGHRDDALAELRIMMAGPCLQGAEELRRDPLWRTLKDDPRFEEILRSAKPL